MESIWENSSLNALITGIGLALVVAALTYTLFRLLLRLADWIESKVESWEKEGRIRGISFQSVEILHSAQIVEALQFAIGAFRVVSIGFLFFFAVSTSLSFFPKTRHLTSKLIHYVFDPVFEVIGVVLEYLPNLFFIAAIAIFTHFLLRAIHFVFKEIERGRVRFKGFYPEWAEPTFKLVRFLVFIFALVAIFPYLPGSGSDAFKGISVFIGLLLSIGSSSAVSNLVAGIILTYMRPFQPGNYVKIGETTGTVIEKTLLVTRIRTVKNEDITVPNAGVLSNHIVNYSAQVANDGLILHTKVTVGYDVPWPKVHSMLKDAALRSDYVLKSPEPFVLQTMLANFTVEYELNSYTNQPNIMPRIYSSIRENIQNVFAEKGIELLSPTFHSVRKGESSVIPAMDTPEVRP
jgi:small-conductance mechanosensitive channel